VKFDGIWELKGAQSLQSAPERKLADSTRQTA
jgi:hypothetical protein